MPAVLFQKEPKSLLKGKFSTWKVYVLGTQPDFKPMKESAYQRYNKTGEAGLIVFPCQCILVGSCHQRLTWTAGDAKDGNTTKPQFQSTVRRSCDRAIMRGPQLQHRGACSAAPQRCTACGHVGFILTAATCPEPFFVRLPPDSISSSTPACSVQ